MRQYLFSTISLLGLIAVVMVAGAGCQKNYRFFEAPVSSLSVPATIDAGEDLQVVLCGSLGEYTPEPTIDRIEYNVSAYLIDIKVIIKEPMGAIAVPASWPWVDTAYVKNLSSGSYEIRTLGLNGMLMTPVIVQ
jgi:hypothetical protein